MSSSSSTTPSVSDRSQAQNLFTDTKHAEDYARYRPVYPSTVFDIIKEYSDRIYSTPSSTVSSSTTTNNSTSRTLVADIATGSGQAAIGLATIYESVIGIDASAAQVEAGTATPPASNITFRVGTAESTGLDTESMDAVCVAEALHWFNQELFWKEVNRILKPGGIVIIIGYAGSKISGNQIANISFTNLFVNILGSYWHPNKTIIDNLYKNYEPSNKEFQNIERYDHLTMEKYWSVDACIGNSHSWSAYITYLQNNPHIIKGSPEDPSEILRKQLNYALQEHNDTINGSTSSSTSLPDYIIPITNENTRGYGFGVSKVTVPLDHEQTEEEKIKRQQGYFHMVWPLTVILAQKPRK